MVQDGMVDVRLRRPTHDVHRHALQGTLARERAALLLLYGPLPRGVCLDIKALGAEPEALRRLMCNSGQQRRSPEFMLHQTLSKGWCGHGSGLLLGFIVRARRRLVEARARLAASEDRSARPTHGPGGPYPGHPRPVAPLPQREGLLEIRPGAPAPLLPHVVLPEPAQSAHPSPGARDAPLAARLRPRARRAFGSLPRDGHHPHPGHREGEGFSPAALLRAGYLRFGRSASKTEWVYGFKVALVVDSDGVITAFGLA